jgi:hypothetical protein
MKKIVVAVVATVLIVTAALSTGRTVVAQQSCLHSQDEAAAQRDRRQQALRLTRQINTLENVARNQVRLYQPVTALPNVTAPPQGFAVHFATDGATYAFSVKDMLDPCSFAYFSDEAGLIYTGQPIQ